MTNETRYGGGFAEGRVLTNYVWELVKELHPEDGKAVTQKDKLALWEKIAYAEAWYNGCNQAEPNIKKNGAETNALGDARNNFLFEYIVVGAMQKDNSRLSRDLQFGSETIPIDTPIDTANVPKAYIPGKRRYEFARDDGYSITTTFWKRLHEPTQDKFGHWAVAPHVMAPVLFSRLDAAIERSNSLAELKRRATNALNKPTLWSYYLSTIYDPNRHAHPYMGRLGDIGGHDDETLLVKIEGFVTEIYGAKPNVESLVPELALGQTPLVDFVDNAVRRLNREARFPMYKLDYALYEAAKTIIMSRG